MNDHQFVVGLGDTERPALGFMPAPAIARRCIEPGNYVLIRDDAGRRRGFLLHGPARPGEPLHIYQACVEYDHRLRRYAADAVAVVALRGQVKGATEISLRCALDLAANAFWIAIGFTLIRYEIGGQQKQRTIARYSLPLNAAIPLCRQPAFF